MWRRGLIFPQLLSPSNVIPHSHPWILKAPNLGCGLGFRRPMLPDLFRCRPKIDFLEIIADHYLEPTPESERELDLLADHFTLIPHGLNLSLGSADGLDPIYVKQFARLVAKLNPPWWSDHIAFTRIDGIEIGHLVSMPPSKASVRVVSQNAARAKDMIGPKLILENITHSITYTNSLLDEADFIADILSETNAGLLLDLTNLWTNARNHRFDESSFLDRLPLDRIVQLHLVGGVKRGDQWIDSHSEPVPDEIFELLSQIHARARPNGLVIERDESIPPLDELTAELDRAREIATEAQSSSPRHASP